MSRSRNETETDDTLPADSLPSSVSVLIPLIIGIAIISVGVVGSYQYVRNREEDRIIRDRSRAQEALTKALGHLKAGEYALAERTADDALQHQPSMALAYLYRAEARVRQVPPAESGAPDEEARRRLARAVEDFTSCLRVATDPEDLFLAYLGRGGALARLGRYEAAEADLTRAIELHPHSGHAHFVRARVRLSEGREDEAAADRLRARELGFPPRNTGAARAAREADDLVDDLVDDTAALSGTSFAPGPPAGTPEER
jgi:Tfp pilus assembly protein PilF